MIGVFLTLLSAENELGGSQKIKTFAHSRVFLKNKKIKRQFYSKKDRKVF